MWPPRQLQPGIPPIPTTFPVRPREPAGRQELALLYLKVTGPAGALIAQRRADEVGSQAASLTRSHTPHFTSYVGSQTHDVVACKACAQDTEHKRASADRQNQGAKSVLRTPTPGCYRAGATAVLKHVCIIRPS